MRGKITGLLLGVAAVATGCQGGKAEFAPVEGTVTLKGVPLANVIVEFYPESGREELRSSSDPTDAAGHYRLRGPQGQDGAIAGVHRVCIYAGREGVRKILDRLPQKARASKRAVLKDQGLLEPIRPSLARVLENYSDINTTSLRVEVRAGEPVIDLNIKTKTQTKKE